MTRMTGPDCAVMCKLIDTHTHTHTHTNTHIYSLLNSHSARVTISADRGWRLRDLCPQGVVLASTQHLRSQGPVSVHAYSAEGVTGVGDGNGDVNGHGDENGARAGTGVEANQ